MGRQDLGSAQQVSFPESHVHYDFKKSVRKEFSFPDHWQMFAQIYFGGMSSTLLSFLPKELEESFKNTFIAFLSLYPSICPLSSFLISLCLSSLTCLDPTVILSVLA